LKQVGSAVHLKDTLEGPLLQQHISQLKNWTQKKLSFSSHLKKLFTFKRLPFLSIDRKEV
jgi:hypothetical protein